MCGIFGVIKAKYDSGSRADDDSREQAVSAFEWLGMLAQERGTHAAGFAMRLERRPPGPVEPVGSSRLAEPDTRLDGWWIRKAPQDFRQFWETDREEYRAAALEARIILGHTRWATAGSRDSLLNTSPLIVGDLIGTHNGGIADDEIAAYYGLPRPAGQTSSEVIFSAIGRAGAVKPNGGGAGAGAGAGGGQAMLTAELDLKAVAKVLSRLRGRAALAWVDRRRPGRVYLARAALSPLSIGWDARGNFYWASNPGWFREMDERTGGYFGFGGVTRLAEGTLLMIKAGGTGEDGGQVVSELSFRPHIRCNDLSWVARLDRVTGQPQ